MSDENNAAHFGEAWATRLAVLLLAGLALATAFTFVQHAHRSQLERVEEPTGVGDVRFAAPPADAQTPAATFHSQPLFGTEHVKRRDSRMFKAGTDDSGAFFVYRSDLPAEKDVYFLKIASEDYLKLSAR